MVRIQIKERHFILNIFLLCLAIFLIIGFVSGYGTNTPDTFGHTAGELSITLNGVTKNLNDAITQGDFANYVPGRIVGGGTLYLEGTSKKCVSWGAAVCSAFNNGELFCPSPNPNSCTYRLIKVECTHSDCNDDGNYVYNTDKDGGLIIDPLTNIDDRGGYLCVAGFPSDCGTVFG